MRPEIKEKPRVGIPWRTLAEEQAGNRRKLDYYFDAVRKAGGEPEEISLLAGEAALAAQVAELNGFILPGSAADVQPERFGQKRHPRTNPADTAREAADSSILRHALETGKPVLGICFGCQMLNVYLGGSLVQDIRSKQPGALAHGATDLPDAAAQGDLRHRARLEPGSRLAELAGRAETTVNSSHHQAIERPGEKLRVTAISPEDGVIEGVERISGNEWIIGVQWHPERMAGDAFAERLFGEFIRAAMTAASREAGTRETRESQAEVSGTNRR
jgi:putative glutamine amidotransferase